MLSADRKGSNRSGKLLLAVGFSAIIALIFIFNIVSFGKKTSTSFREAVDAKTFIETITKSYDEGLTLKQDFLNFNGLAARLMGKRMLNDCVKLYNGQLVRTAGLIKITAQAEKLISLDKFLSDRGAEMLYVQSPTKISKYDNQLPVGITDYSNNSADEMLRLLVNNNVKTLDLREQIAVDGIDHSSLFFVTDHHWKPEAGFWAFGKIIKYLNKNLGSAINELYTDINQYNVKVYKDWFLGTSGKRTGIFYAGVDDISLITPKFETEMAVIFPSEYTLRSGTFSETIFNMKAIATKDYFNQNTYSTYIGGDFPLVIHKNAKADSDLKILMIKDSYLLPEQAFMSLCFKQVDVIDLRYYKESTLLEYIEVTNPDIVIVQYNPSMLGPMVMFEFGDISNHRQGINYLLDSSREFVFENLETFGDVTLTQDVNVSDSFLYSLRGRYVTLSMDVLTEYLEYKEGNSWIGLNFSFEDNTGSTVQKDLPFTDVIAAGSHDWKRYAITAQIPYDVRDITNCSWIIRNCHGKLVIKNAKLEIGKTATEWCTAPEDEAQYRENLLENADKYNADEVLLNADKNNFSYIMLYNQFEPGHTYTFSLESMTLLSGKAAGVMVVLYDFANKTNTAMKFFYQFELKKPSWTFTIPNDGTVQSLLIYAGIRGSTAGNTFVCNGLALQKQ